MPAIVRPATPPVKPAIAHAVAGFDRWAAAQMVDRPIPTEAEAALADRLAWVADGGDPEDYPGPEWRGESTWRERQLADFRQRLDAERDEEKRQHELELQARAAGCWDRVVGRALI